MIEGVDVRLREGRTLVVRVAEGCGRAAALAEVLKLVDASALSLQAIHSGQNETEDAYLQLLQEEVAHGFSRFDLGASHANDAPAGDPAS